ncbi:hypothetical protein SKAU_G00189460 [Synaphobranchus kaupii]|uniref:Uncharacterized protein n=1 Tax=Synaphobranchus kaupii TaxID=118154 RepID=A0A9Q1IV21_SYNKA|nr:hypothetical protein SKAU_G00189460 [Synaphobranchus kaupii]
MSEDFFTRWRKGFDDAKSQKNGRDVSVPLPDLLSLFKLRRLTVISAAKHGEATVPTLCPDWPALSWCDHRHDETHHFQKGPRHQNAKAARHGRRTGGRDRRLAAVDKWHGRARIWPAARPGLMTA